MRSRSRVLGGVLRAATAVAAVASLLLVYSMLQWALDDRARRALSRDRADDRPIEAVRLARLDPVLVETSGLAVSRMHPGVLWSHNDSGDEPRFFALDTLGRVLGTFAVTGATAVDWEDADLGPCPSPAAGHCLWLGDIGDNATARGELRVWVVPEPAQPTMAGPAAVEPLGSIAYRYPDEPHDAEALAVSPAGDLVIVTKGRTPTIQVFVLPTGAVADALGSDSVTTLPRGAVLPIGPDFAVGRAVTGASFDPSGRLLAVRSYTEVWFLEGVPGGTPVVHEPSCWLGRMEQQGEAVAWADGSTLLLTSEAARGEPATLSRVRCRLPG